MAEFISRIVKMLRGGGSAGDAGIFMREAVIASFLTDPNMSVFEALSTARRLLEGSNSIRDLERLSKSLSALKGGAFIPSALYSVADVLSRKLDSLLESDASRDSVEEKKAVVARLIELLEKELRMQFSEVVNALTGIVYREPRLVVAGYSSIVVDAIKRAKNPRISVVAIERYPFLDGRRIARELRRSRVNSLYVPDINVEWAIARSEALLIPVYGAYGDVVVCSSGAKMLTASARRGEVRVMGVTIDANYYPVPVAENFSAKDYFVASLSSVAAEEELAVDGSVNVFEEVPISSIDVLVSSTLVINSPERGSLENASRSVKERFEKLSSMVG